MLSFFFFFLLVFLWGVGVLSGAKVNSLSPSLPLSTLPTCLNLAKNADSSYVRRSRASEENTEHTVCYHSSVKLTVTPLIPQLIRLCHAYVNC